MSLSYFLLTSATVVVWYSVHLCDGAESAGAQEWLLLVYFAFFLSYKGIAVCVLGCHTSSVQFVFCDAIPVQCSLCHVLSHGGSGGN